MRLGLTVAGGDRTEMPPKCSRAAEGHGGAAERFSGRASEGREVQEGPNVQQPEAEEDYRRGRGV